MLIAIPIEQGLLVSHFGRCRQVRLFQVDPTSQQVQHEQTLEMPRHEPGVFPTWLRDQGVELVIAGGMGAKALTLFADAGIRVVSGASSLDPRQLVDDYFAGRLAGGTNACSHGDDHHCEHPAQGQP